MTRPSLSVRAFAEMLHLPAYEQLRILHEQKHPRRQPQAFRVSYYQPALGALRRFYHLGRKREVLDQARAAIKAHVRSPSRRMHNLRVLDAFEHSDEVERRLTLQPQARITARVGEVDLRLRSRTVIRIEQTAEIVGALWTLA